MPKFHENFLLSRLKLRQLRLLTAIADTPGEEVQSAEGKARLRKRLVATINKVLTDTEGFGGVDAVYFKTFIVQ